MSINIHTFVLSLTGVVKTGWGKPLELNQKYLALYFFIGIMKIFPRPFGDVNYYT